MVYGIPATERLQLNEETIWAGQPNKNANPHAKAALFTSLLLCNVWFFFHCKNKLIKLLNVVLVYTSTDYRERSKVL